MIQLCYQIIHYDLGRTYYKMSISEKIKTIDKKIEKNKAQYKLVRQAAKISTLSSGNVSQHDFLTRKDVLSAKNLFQKAAAMERFEYYPSDK